MTDGWEYWSAKDLNHEGRALPRSAALPNALDPSTAVAAGRSALDFDGDGLTSARGVPGRGAVLLRRYPRGRRPRPGAASPTATAQVSVARAEGLPVRPPGRATAYGLARPAQPFPATFNLWGDRQWRDDERDADGDGLSGTGSSRRGPGRPSYWGGTEHRLDRARKKTEYLRARPPTTRTRPSRPSPTSTCRRRHGRRRLLDGEDDKDHDDLSNQFEVRRPGNGHRLDDEPLGPHQPLNPCKPFTSERCTVTRPSTTTRATRPGGQPVPARRLPRLPPSPAHALRLTHLPSSSSSNLAPAPS